MAEPLEADLPELDVGAVAVEALVVEEQAVAELNEPANEVVENGLAAHNNTPAKPENVNNIGLDCYMCKERLKEPKLLTCMHTFCLECLRHLHKEYNGMMSVQCVFCNTISQVDELETLATNVLVKNIIEALQTMKNEDEDGNQCNDCEEEDATTYCFDCQYKLCETCVNEHKRKRKSKGHVLVTLNTVTQEELVKNFYHRCPKHAKDLEFYCDSCEAVVCHYCTISKVHEGHRPRLLEEIVGEKKEDLKCIVKTTKEKELTVSKAIDDAERKNVELLQIKEQSILEIKGIFDVMKAHLVEQEHKLVYEINKIFDDGVVSIAKAKGIADAFLNCTTYIESLEKNGSDTEFMHVFRDLKSHLELISNGLEGSTIQLTSVIMEKRVDFPPEQSFQVLSEEYIKCLDRKQEDQNFP